MRKIESPEDQMRGTVTYELDDGRFICLDARQVRDYGLEEMLKGYGVDVPKGRVPVFQRGRQIGTVPATFEPAAIKSMSFLYDVRPGDFYRTSEGWEASKTMGPGDFEAVPGFVWDRQ
jgi:hypothetical protein